MTTAAVHPERSAAVHPERSAAVHPERSAKRGVEGSALVLLLLLAGCKEPAQKEPIRIAAAADLAPVLEASKTEFEQALGETLVFSFGASGALATQLEQGAPFDAFAAADASFLAGLADKGVCDKSTVAEYARGTLVAWPKAGVTAPASLAELADAKYGRIAIANPEHAPYGRAAKQALEAAGVWEKVKDKVVFGENVRATFQFAESGNADVALVSASLAQSKPERKGLAVDPALHAPLAQTLAVCLRGKNAAGARKFAALLTGERGRAALSRHGFSFTDGGAGAAP
jgi:molybdate transport system substrate-binding protein